MKGPSLKERADSAPPVTQIEPGIEPTERFIAMEWARLNSVRCRYDHGIGRWFQFDDVHWEEDKTRAVFHSIAELANRIGRGSKATGKAGTVRGIEAFAQADPRVAVTHEIWDADPMLLGTPAGTVDLKTGKLRVSKAEEYLTRQASVAPRHGRPELWLRFLDEATGGDAELIRFLQQVLGYALTGDTREHALFFVYGAGKNGKSVFLNTAARIMGKYASTAAMETFAASRGDRHPTELARLDGARLVSASETEEGRAWAEARIKQLTGGDPIAARFMRGDFFEFTPKFKLIIVGNHQPSLHNVDPATRRRFNIIPFTHTPANPDPQLEQKLEAEHGMILNWMIEGCRDWLANGLTRPAAVSAATEDYFESQDVLGQWIAERCVTGKNEWEQPTILFRDWSEYARASGEDAGTNKSFGSKLEKRGFRAGRRPGGIRCRQGISLRC